MEACSLLFNQMINPKLFLILLPLADIFLTYQVLWRTQTHQKDYYVLEANPLARNVFRKIGLKKGIAILGLFSVGLGTLAIISVPTNALYFYVGMYYAIIYHNSYALYRTIKSFKKIENTKKVK